jgi:Planctomycete cytochrome C
MRLGGPSTAGALESLADPMTVCSLYSVASRSWTAMMLAAALLGSACDGDSGDSDDDGASCVVRDASACTPLYEPTWERVLTETITPRCGTPGSACHGEPTATGADGGLVVSEMAATHAALLDGGFVRPGDAACSELMVRLDTDDDAQRMPPGAQALAESERCSIARWIEDGAPP